MGSPVEVIPGWSAINERLDSTLVQLNRLMHHYADVTPNEGLRDPDPSRKPCVSEECLDTDMQDILREAQTRLQEFTETMQRLTGGPASADQSERQLRESNEACERSLADSERQVFLLKRELSHSQKEVGNLQKRMREYEYAIDQVRDNSAPNVKLTRELERTRAELLDRTKEYEAILSMKESVANELNEIKKVRKEEARGRQQEAGREKMQKQREVRDLKENFQREVLTATQHHLDREMELQKYCQKEKDAHFKSIEDMMVLHKDEIKKLKEEHAIKFEECCQNHANLESEWQDKEFELQKEISIGVQEKAHYVQQLFDEQVKVQALDNKIVELQSNIANEKSSKNQVESELKFTKVDLSLMEEKALALQKDLSSITSTCVHSEHELQSHKIKFERLQKNIEIKQKDLVAASLDIQKLQQEVKFLQSEIKSKNEEIKTIQRTNEIQCQQLQTTVFKLKMEEKQKCEDIVFKTKEAMETELQRQAQQHKENVYKLQKQIQLQREKLNKQYGSNFRWGEEGMCRS